MRIVQDTRKLLVTPIETIPAPEGPFRHIMLDFVDISPKIECGKRYILVVIDRFSRCVEEEASAKNNAHVVASSFAER